MILLSLNKLHKTYGEKVIFNELTLSIEDTEKIGLIGINGTGKSTLLKIIAGLSTSDKGEVITSNELVIEYLPQDPSFDDNATVIEQIFKGTSQTMKTLRDYEIVVSDLEKEPSSTALQTRLMELTEQMDSQDIWQLESEAKAILTKLGIVNFRDKVSLLSGGQRKKIALAGALIRPCNLLILDEPTNHLDNDTIDYLEELLKNKKCGLIMVTHDRYFLDRVTNRIVELDGGKLYKYEGNYESYIEQKAQRESIEERMREKNMTLYKQELEWMRKGVEARRTKQKARKDRFYELEDSLEGGHKQSLEMNLGTSRLGKKIISMEAVNKSFEGKPIIKDFTYTFVREDRIGIIGDNGAGKSTLLNIIADRLKEDSGIVDIGETVKIGYYTQENKELDPNIKVIDYIKDRGEYVKTADGTLISASKMLEKFLFPPTVQYTPIEKLSGGEKRRLYLLGVLMGDINVLLLDEPTNDLDIYTLQILENYIDEFDGPVIAVSHDRYFLDRMSDKIFSYEGHGAIANIPGNYTDYRNRKIKMNDNKSELKVDKSVGNKKSTSAKKEFNATTKLKFSYNEKLEYEKIDSVIEELETLIEDVEKEILMNSSNYAKLGELTSKKEELEEELTKKMERWEYLNELAEKIAAQ